MCEIIDNEDNLRMNITKAQSLCAALSAYSDVLDR